MMKKKVIFAAVAFALMNVANASVFTLSSSGVLKSGADPLGLFGEAGRSLIGLPFSLTVTMDLDETARYSIQGLEYSSVRATSPYIVAATVGGYDYAFSVPNTIQDFAEIGAYQAANPPDSAHVSLAADGYDQFGRFNYVSQLFRTTAIRSNSLTQYFQTRFFEGAITFQVNDGTKRTYFGGQYFDGFGLDTFTINGTPATLPVPVPDPVPGPAPTPVPEPASAMLFGAGLLGLAALRRRQSRR
jgi:hypothetical protein